MNITTPKDHFYQLEKPQKMNKKNIIFLAVGIIAIILIGYFWGGKKIALAPSDNLNNVAGKKENNSNITTTISSSKITLSNQIPGEVVLISEVTMPEQGWVAVHDDNEGEPGNILGAYFLPAGTHKSQMIPLLRAITDDNSYLIVIHGDNGDRVFDYKADTPILNTNGQIETAVFSVIAESPRGE